MLSLPSQRVGARALILPDDFARKMAIEMPLYFSGATRQDDLTQYYREMYAQLNSIQRNCNYASVAAMAQSIADTMNSCINTRIQSICKEFEVQSDYDALHARLKELRLDTSAMRRNMHVLFYNDMYRTGPGFHRGLFLNPHSTILTEVVRECKLQLVPVIQTRIYDEFLRRHNIVATAKELEQLAEKFDTVGVFQDIGRQPKPLATGLAAAKVCAIRLLPQLEKTYIDFVQCMIMSLHSSNHTTKDNILRHVMSNQDVCMMSPMLDDKVQAIKYCHALAYADRGGDAPELLKDCPSFFRPV
jgi:hypothetical protein